MDEKMMEDSRTAVLWEKFYAYVLLSYKINFDNR